MDVKCPLCGIDVPGGTRFCPQDGAVLNQQTIALSTSQIQIVGPVPPPVPAVAVAVPTAAPADEEPDASAGDLLLGRIIDDRYAVRRLLGRGAMGAVYEAEQVELKKLVALKVVQAVAAQTEDFRKRFEREAQAASRLSHPGCISVLDFSRVARVEPASGGERLIGVAYLVMELVQGELLLDRLERGKLTPREAVAVARRLLAALGHAHSLEIVHRDVKPANIMLVASAEAEPQIKLLDFGLAKSMAQGSPDTQQPLTAYGMVFGTPKYLSPEQAGAKPLDRRSDLYSAGVVLFEMVCGRPPFDRDDLAALVRDHLVTSPPSPRLIIPSISKELDAVLLKALAKDPDQRFQTAQDYLSALAACPEALPISTASPPSATKSAVLRQRLLTFAGASRRWSKAAVAHVLAQLGERLRGPRRKMLAAGLGVLVMLAGSLLFVLARPATTPVPTSAAVPVATPMLVAESTARHLRSAAEYSQKLWCADAIEELERALNETPALRADPELVRISVPCLRAKTQAKAIRFLVDRVGPDAHAELQAALSGDLKPDVRQGVERALARLTPGR